MSATRWNILLPGPSLSDLKEKPPGKVVSVNRALMHTIVPDYWAALDNPRRLSMLMGHLRQKKPIIWCPVTQKQHWDKEDLSSEFETWDFRKASVPWLQKMMSRSVFFAIEGCARQGAQEIVLYGCDMLGDNYFAGMDGSNWPKDRWEKEGRCLKNIQIEARKAGVIVRRHGESKEAILTPPPKTLPERVEELRGQFRQRPTTPIRWATLSAALGMYDAVLTERINGIVAEIDGIRTKLDQYGKPTEPLPRISPRTGKPVRKYTKKAGKDK